MASGAIAYDYLAHGDPAAIVAVDALMAQHPDHARFDSALGSLTGAARDRRLFELIARWPDEVRRTPYNRTHWHHEVRVVSGWTIFAPVRLGVAESAFDRNWHILRDGRADPARRAVALCWVFHLVGDMHQPLHAGHRMDARFPLTDHAGTKGWVRISADAAPVTLHRFWDMAADRPGGDTQGAEALAQTVEAGMAPQSPLAVTESVEAEFHAWVRESEALAASVAYRGSGLAAARRRDDAPILSPAYIADAQKTAKRRLGQASRRLADLIALAFPPGQTSGP